MACALELLVANVVALGDQFVVPTAAHCHVLGFFQLAVGQQNQDGRSRLLAVIRAVSDIAVAGVEHHMPRELHRAGVDWV
ncbi:hypothetical protein D3C71_1860790 [compost metagenome]